MVAVLAVVAAGGLLYVIVVLVVAIVEWFAERPFLAGATVGSAAGVAACWAYLRARRWWRESIVPMQAAWRLKRASALKLPRVTLAAEAGTVSSGADPRAQRIEEALRQYRPLQAYSSEIGYHAELAGSLRGSFSTLEVEVQRGQSRPDIVIGDVAIEVKGPTGVEELQSLADKCARYLQHFSHLYIVLFDVRVPRRRYLEWRKGIVAAWPNIRVIEIEVPTVADNAVHSFACANCGDDATVPFTPRGRTALYCSSCYAERLALR